MKTNDNFFSNKPLMLLLLAISGCISLSFLLLMPSGEPDDKNYFAIALFFHCLLSFGISLKIAIHIILEKIADFFYKYPIFKNPSVITKAWATSIIILMATAYAYYVSGTLN